MTNPSPPGGETEHPALFPWFPSHRVGLSEQQARAESLLGQIPLFSAVPPHRLRTIFQMTRANRFSAGETVFKEGEPGSTMHVITSGRISIIGVSEGGDEVVLASLGPGEFFGELALFDRRPRSATAVAAEDTETLSLARADILEIIHRYPDVALAFLSSIGARLRTTDRLLESLMLENLGDAMPPRTDSE